MDYDPLEDYFIEALATAFEEVRANNPHASVFIESWVKSLHKTLDGYKDEIDLYKLEIDKYKLEIEALKAQLKSEIQ